MNENIQLNISRLQTYFEELEKRIKSVERQMTTTNQVSAIQSCLAEIKEVLLEYQSTYSELVSEYNTHKQDYDQKVNTNTTEHSTFSSSISSLNANVTTLQNNVEDLQSKVSALENSTGGGTGSGSGCLCGNNSDFCHNYINCYMYDSQYYSPNFVLLANQNQYIDIKLKVKLKSSQAVESSTYTITLDLNGENVVSNSYAYNTETETKELSYRYYPTKNSNTIRFFITGSRILFLYDYTIEVNGRDIMLDAKMPAINIRCFDDKYYIVKWDNDSGILYFDVQDKANLSLSEQNLQTDSITTSTNYAFINAILIPTLSESSTFTYNTEYSQNIRLVILTQKNYKENIELEYDETLSKFVKSGTASIYANKIDISPCLNSNGSMICAYAKRDNKAIIKNSSISINIINEALTEKFYNVCIVQYNYAKIGESKKAFAGAIFQRSDGMWIFYPTWENKTNDNSTRTEIAVGNNCTAYLQTDGTINVYINVGLKVYKYTLTKNANTSKYDLNSSYSVINGVTKYEELLDGKALAHTYDTYKIVDM